jgi:hypothetical protein
VVLVAIPFKDYKTLPADQLSGKVDVDVMNYYPQRDGSGTAKSTSATSRQASYSPFTCHAPAS